MTIGFIGLGNIGKKLASTLIRNKFEVIVNDIDPNKATSLVKAGASWRNTPSALTKDCDFIITCLPSVKICTAVIEGKAGVLESIKKGHVWIEMSTTSHEETVRLAEKIKSKGGDSADCPVSGGCHRAETGNISIFAGCERSIFEKIKPILIIMGRRVLHTGPVGTASLLKVMTNFLATANLISCCEALTTMKGLGFDLGTTFEAIKISSGNSFVHETESQVILNGSRQIDFTLGLVLKDIKLFQDLANSHNIPLELSPLLIKIFKDGIAKYGQNENSPSIIKRLEEKTGLEITTPGFPKIITDQEKEEPGFEVIVTR